MIIFQSKGAVSREQVEIFQRHFRAARDSGTPLVIPPDWTFEEVAVPSMFGPLVDYMAQLGDA